MQPVRRVEQLRRRGTTLIGAHKRFGGRVVRPVKHARCGDRPAHVDPRVVALVCRGHGRRARRIRSDVAIGVIRIRVDVVAFGLRCARGQPRIRDALWVRVEPFHRDELRQDEAAHRVVRRPCRMRRVVRVRSVLRRMRRCRVCPHAILERVVFRQVCPHQQPTIVCGDHVRIRVRRGLPRRRHLHLDVVRRHERVWPCVVHLLCACRHDERMLGRTNLEGCCKLEEIVARFFLRQRSKARR